MKTLEAVIEIGSTAIRLMVFQVDSSSMWTTIDRAELPVALGRDVFTNGDVSRETLLQCIRILNRFSEQLAGWGINRNHTSIIATSAVREASNRDMFIDRIYVKTRYKVKVIDGIEENRLMYLSSVEILRTAAPQILDQNAVIIEIGGGSTEFMILQDGKMAAAHSLRLGTVIIDQYTKAMLGSVKDSRRFLSDYIKTAGMNMSTETDFTSISEFIALGPETLIAAREVGKKLGDRIWSISKQSFFDFVNSIKEFSIEECLARFKISYNEAYSLQVGLLTYKLFMELTTTEEMIVLDVSVREGFLINRISAPDDLQPMFCSQIIASARSIGKKYSYDESHAIYVHDTALKIYDKMENELGLPASARLQLEVAAYLHDIGVFIRSRDHHIHSQYIISNSDIFGLTHDSIKIISLVARYHRGIVHYHNDEIYQSLSRIERTQVLKIAAILRVADALDRGHCQHIKNFTIELQEDRLVLHMQDVRDINLEKMAVAEKSDLFESVFGYSVTLL
ncbi:MAG TPA: HD domain-containing protein [Treponemataceae bacterium]|nr:HD domain-containing protein [Treponemataceae bacterium]